jgi:hypothetical protein
LLKVLLKSFSLRRSLFRRLDKDAEERRYFFIGFCLHIVSELATLYYIFCSRFFCSITQLSGNSVYFGARAGFASTFLLALFKGYYHEHSRL